MAARKRQVDELSYSVIIAQHSSNGLLETHLICHALEEGNVRGVGLAEGLCHVDRTKIADDYVPAKLAVVGASDLDNAVDVHCGSHGFLVDVNSR